MCAYLIIPLGSICDLGICAVRVPDGCLDKIFFRWCKVFALSTINGITDTVWKFFFLPADRVLSIVILDFSIFRCIIGCFGIIDIIIVDRLCCTFISCLVNDHCLDLKCLVRNTLADRKFDRCLGCCSVETCTFGVRGCIVYFIFDIRKVRIFSCDLQYRICLAGRTGCCLSGCHLRITCKCRCCTVDRKPCPFSISIDVSVVHSTDDDLIISFCPLIAVDSG